MIFAPQSSREIFALTISTLKLVLGLGSKKEPKKVWICLNSLGRNTYIHKLLLSVIKLPSCHAKWLSVIASKTFVQHFWLIFYIFEEQTGNNGGLMMTRCQNYAGISFNWNSWICSFINIFSYTLACLTSLILWLKICHHLSNILQLWSLQTHWWPKVAQKSANRGKCRFSMIQT